MLLVPRAIYTRNLAAVVLVPPRLLDPEGPSQGALDMVRVVVQLHLLAIQHQVDCCVTEC